MVKGRETVGAGNLDVMMSLVGDLFLAHITAQEKVCHNH